MKVLFDRCACKDGTYDRISRSLWMRFLSSRLLYQCSECHARILTSPDNIPAINWQITTAKPFLVKPKPDPTAEQK